MFTHNLIELPKIVQINSESGRTYLTPNGNKYPSVTTVIGAMSDKSGLDVWRARVGDKEAARATSYGAARGTASHNLWEKLVLNQDLELQNEMPTTIKMFRQLEKFLLENVDSIMVSEGGLFSHKLRVAGSVDLVALYKGKLAIIDFKTSGKPKKKDWIYGYFLQATMYAYMFWEMTGILCPTIVIAIAVENDNQPQIFVEKTSDYILQAKKMCDEYHKSINIS